MKRETCFYSAEKPVTAPTYDCDNRDYLNELRNKRERLLTFKRLIRLIRLSVDDCAGPKLSARNPDKKIFYINSIDYHAIYIEKILKKNEIISFLNISSDIQSFDIMFDMIFRRRIKLRKKNKCFYI